MTLPPSPSAKQPWQYLYRYVGPQDDCYGLIYRFIDTSKEKPKAGDEWKEKPWPFKKGEIFLWSIPSGYMSNIQVTNICEFRVQKKLDPAFESCHIWMGSKKEFQEQFKILNND